jgi:hypothetical protein
MQYTKEFIKTQLENDDTWLCRGIVAIFNKQTQDEQAAETTSQKNGVGFNGSDAEFLSSLAKQFQKKGTLSPRQIEFARKKMLKYSGQLTSIANGIL